MAVYTRCCRAQPLRQLGFLVHVRQTHRAAVVLRGSPLGTRLSNEYVVHSLSSECVVYSLSNECVVHSLSNERVVYSLSNECVIY